MQAFTGRPQEWDELIAALPDPDLLQTWEWAQVKSAYGWEPLPFVWREPWSEASPGTQVEAATMILKKTISIAGFSARMCILYCPKGPLLDWGSESTRGRVMDDLQQFTRQQGGIFLKIDPDVVLGRGIPGTQEASDDARGQIMMEALISRGWKFSSDQVQFRNTVLVDLTPSEEDMLARMKQKTRYNIRLADKKGVTVRAGNIDDLLLLYRMYAETSVRDGFVIRNENYYRTVWTAFMHVDRSESLPCAEPLIAEVDGEPVAALFVFYFARRAYYLYGMSREAHREKMPNHLLQWEAMRRAKKRGCQTYDLWGAPDDFVETDPMWGVFRFKEGLGGQVLRTLGGWDYAPRPLWYRLYAEFMPRVLEVMRSRGRRATKQQIDV